MKNGTTPSPAIPSTRLTVGTRTIDLFDRAKDLAPQDQLQFIERETGEDEQLRANVLSLLEFDSGRSASPISRAVGEAIDLTTRDRRRELIGKVISNYRLKESIG